MPYCPKCNKRAAYLVDNICKVCAAVEVCAAVKAVTSKPKKVIRRPRSRFVISHNGGYKIKGRRAVDPDAWGPIEFAQIYKTHKVAEVACRFMSVGTIKEIL